MSEAKKAGPWVFQAVTDQVLRDAHTLASALLFVPGKGFVLVAEPAFPGAPVATAEVLGQVLAGKSPAP